MAFAGPQESVPEKYSGSVCYAIEYFWTCPGAVSFLRQRYTVHAKAWFKKQKAKEEALSVDSLI